MPITIADLKYKFSVKTGAAGNSTAGTANGALGKYISTTEITDNTLNGLFDDVTGAENAALESEYRCFFIHNSHASLTLLAPVMWITSQAAGGADILIGVDTTAPSAIGSASAQALEVADENTAPVGVTFSGPTTKATGIALSSIPAGQCLAVWVKRTATNSAAMNGDAFGFRIEGDTLA